MGCTGYKSTVGIVGGVILDRDVARPQFLSQKTDAAAVTASHPLKIIPLKLFCNHAIRKSNFFLIIFKSFICTSSEIIEVQFWWI